MKLTRFVVAAAGVGLGMTYFMDPEKGPRRRRMAANRTAGLVRRAERQIQQVRKKAEAGA